ncbi:Uncharacterized protein FKW44_005762, partial [Caligus rogercresseyi]
NSSRSHLRSGVNLAKFYDPYLDPVDHVITYISKTKEMRGSVNNLFVTIKGICKLISIQTASRWLKDMMVLVGLDIDAFKPHSLRSASVALRRAMGSSIQ